MSGAPYSIARRTLAGMSIDNTRLDAPVRQD
jgi:hypothetical protein